MRDHSSSKLHVDPHALFAKIVSMANLWSLAFRKQNQAKLQTGGNLPYLQSWIDQSLFPILLHIVTSVPVANCHVHKLLVIYALDFDWSSVLIRRGIRRYMLLCEDKIICFQIESLIGDEVQYYVITRSIHLFSLFQDARWKQLLSSFIKVTILEAILDCDVIAWMVK